METRTRAKRAAAAAAAPSPKSRNARDAKSTTNPSASESSARTRQKAKQPSSEDTNAATPLTSNLIPRRGARAHSVAASLASVPTRVGGESEDEADEEEEMEASHVSVVEEEQDEEEEAQAMNLGQGDDDDGAAPQNDDHAESEADIIIRREIMALGIRDLQNRTQEFVALLQQDYDADDPVYNGLLKIKRNAFLNVREIFEDRDRGLEPFIDWTKLSDLNIRANLAAPAAETTLARANLATVLNSIDIVRAGGLRDKTMLLSRLDEVFPDLLLAGGAAGFRPEETAELALDIRTHLVLESIVGIKAPKETYPIMASAFCGDDAVQPGTNYASLLTHGPFRTLVDSTSGDEVESCVDRIRQIVALIKKPAALRDRFPLDKFFDRLSEWVLQAYGKLASASARDNALVSAAAAARPDDEFHDAEEQFSDDAGESMPESQPIQRTREAERTLFQGASSLRFLNDHSKHQGSAAAPLTRPPPPSAQRTVPSSAAPEDAPLDYPQHSNEDILNAPSPEPRARRYFSSQPAGASGAGEDDDDDDPFEEDTRPVAPGKRAAIESKFPPPTKRSRVTSNHPAPTFSSASFAVDMPPPPRPPSSRPTASAPTTTQQHRVSSSPVDFASLREQKRAILERHRLESAAAAAASSSQHASPESLKQRHAWSEHDCATLLDLVARHRAAWSVIETTGKELFERPRNQQAYRDKARNMKVDYLLTDRVLPPGFDSVHLGKKEIERLESLGKNPWRKQGDLDQWDQPINTEFMPASPHHGR